MLKQLDLKKQRQKKNNSAAMSMQSLVVFRCFPWDQVLYLFDKVIVWLKWKVLFLEPYRDYLI